MPCIGFRLNGVIFGALSESRTSTLVVFADQPRWRHDLSLLYTYPNTPQHPALARRCMALSP